MIAYILLPTKMVTTVFTCTIAKQYYSRYRLFQFTRVTAMTFCALGSVVMCVGHFFTFVKRRS